MSKNTDIESLKEWEQLKEILTGEEKRQIESILRRLDDDKIHASEISRILPEALRLSAKHGNRLNEVLIPIIEKTLQESMRRNSHILVDALYALIGPATRKAVFESMKGLLQSFNTALESVFTLKGIKWRIEAITTGKPYAEVVLIHSIVYQVEQVFLIHKETGLLLQHVKTDNIIVQNEDMVSGMLTAIQDFVHDSFQVSENDALNTMNVGEMTVWVEQSPHTVLAAVIRGTAPESLRQLMTDTIERIHSDYIQDLVEFEGDTDVFQPSAGELEKCLEKQVKTDKKKTPAFAWGVITAAVLIFMSFLYFQISDSIRWGDYTDSLRKQPGILVLNEDRGIFTNYISGMKDMYSESPDSLLKNFGYTTENVESEWLEYLALDPQMMIRKAILILDAPETISFSFSNGLLKAWGKCNEKWYERALRTAPLITGVKDIDFSGISLSEGENVDAIIKSIEKTYINFVKNKTRLIKGQDEKVEKLVQKIRNLIKLSPNKEISLEIMGHTDSSGSEKTNAKLSWNRAKSFMELLSTHGLIDIDFTIKGIAYSQPLVEEKTENDRQLNRRVSFDVKLGWNEK